MEVNSSCEEIFKAITEFYGLETREHYSFGNQGLSICRPDSARGSGSIALFYSKRQLMILADVTFSRDEAIPGIINSAFWVGYFSEADAEIQYGDGRQMPAGPDTLLAGMGCETDWQAVMHGGQKMQGIIVMYESLVHRPDYNTPSQKEISCNPRVPEVRDVIRNVNGLKNVPQLSSIIYQLRSCDSRDISKFYYFRAKLHEITSVLLDLSEQKNEVQRNARSISEEDRRSIHELTVFISNNLATHTGLSKMAQMVCMSPAKLKYTFKAVTGRSVTEYRQDRRMEQAQYLLTNTDRQMSTIARSLGYASASHFSASFRDRTGMTPSEYREIYSNKQMKS